ncbi:MAG: hypothetical protein MUF15_17715, partial [Acidobacteria bacterium]|nr:hypothetical protein [Acidobacteriota bacterium]
MKKLFIVMLFVSLLASFVSAKSLIKFKQTVVDLIPVPSEKRYDLKVRSGAAPEELAAASKGTVRSDGRGQDPYMIHAVDGKVTDISWNLSGQLFHSPAAANARLAESRPEFAFHITCLGWLLREYAPPDVGPPDDVHDCFR